jgi:hypothetical protein
MERNSLQINPIVKDGVLQQHAPQIILDRNRLVFRQLANELSEFPEKYVMLDPGIIVGSACVFLGRNYALI